MDKQNRNGRRLLVIALGCVFSVFAQLAAAEGTFACHVVNANGHPDVFFVQTDDRKEVHAAALRAQVGGKGRHDKAPVAEVVQCIEYPQGRFHDSAMQNYLRNLPR